MPGRKFPQAGAEFIAECRCCVGSARAGPTGGVPRRWRRRSAGERAGGGPVARMVQFPPWRGRAVQPGAGWDLWEASNIIGCSELSPDVYMDSGSCWSCSAGSCPRPTRPHEIPLGYFRLATGVSLGDRAQGASSVASRASAWSRPLGPARPLRHCRARWAATLYAGNALGP